MTDRYFYENFNIDPYYEHNLYRQALVNRQMMVGGTLDLTINEIKYDNDEFDDKMKDDVSKETGLKFK